MLIAVGMYLPFDTRSAIFRGRRHQVGGVEVPGAIRRRAKRQAEETGTLLASGLIAGEAIVGILLAVLFLTGVSSITHVLTGTDQFAWFPALGGWLSLGAFAAIAWTLIELPRRRATRTDRA